MERRLAAILAADIVGYSRMMSDDEAATLAVLRRLHEDLVEPVVANHSGLIFKRLGDGWLVRFASALDAVRCAIAIQDALADQPSARMRIGVHVGDVTHLDGDYYGDGVNVASRLEGLAVPGGIAISDAVRSSLDGTLRPEFVDSGPRALKNIAGEVRVWARAGRHDPIEAASARASEAAGGATSVAVAAFEAQNQSPDLDSLAEGIGDDLATELSRFRWLHVVGGGNGTAARYKLGGTVRAAGQRVRITAHLTHAGAGRRVWSERWDRDASDLLAVQDELASIIVSAVCTEIDAHEKSLVQSRPVESLSAHELSLRANQILSTGEIDLLDEAEALMTRAIAMEPANPQGYVQQALVSYHKMNSGGWPPQEAGQAALDMTRKAVALEPRLANGYGLMAAIYGVLGQTRRALDAADRTAELNPNAWGAPHGRAIAYAFAPADWVVDPPAHAEALLAHARETLRMAPNTAYRSGHRFYLGLGLLMRDAAGDLSEAIAELDRSASHAGASWWPSLFLALAELRRQREDAARQRVADARRVFPALTRASVERLFHARHVAKVWEVELARLTDVGLARD